MTSLAERTRLSRALNDIDGRIHANLGSEEILQSALDGFVEALGADAGDIKLLEDGEWVVRYERGFGPGVVGERLTFTEAPVAVEAARTRQPVVISDLVAPGPLPYVGFPAAHNLRAAVGVPLIGRGEVVGCLFAWMREEPREVTPAELDFARRMAASLALALENARLFEAEQHARRRAEDAEARLGLELERTRVLLKASDQLTSTTYPDELLERLGRIVLEATGIDRVFINLIDAAHQVLIPKVASGGLIAPGGARIPFNQLSWTSQRAISDQATVVLDYEVPDLPERDRDIANSNSVRLALFVPLVYQDEVVGHITLDQPDQRYAFSAEQIRIVESIAAQATVALQNARQYQREHRIAETLQLALLAPPEQIDGVEIALLYQAASEAASVGGDFYDVFRLDDENVAMIVGDVAGKGVWAAQLTALMRDGARAYLIETGDPAESFKRLNALAYRFTPPDKFATAFLGVLNHSTGLLRYCNAAHPEPVVMSGGGVRALESEPAGLLGAFAEAQFSSSETVLAPGETIVIITDGVTEARRGGELLGGRGLLDALARLNGMPVSELPQALLGEVIRYADDGLRDDVVVLCATLTG